MPVRAILKKIFRKKSDKVDDDDMPKRKAESAVVEEMPKPKKTIVTATDGGYSTQQKTAIAEFSEVTGIRDQKSAAKLLKSHNYQVTAAVNAYFSNPSNTASNPIRSNMSKIFDKYRENPREEPDEINVEGVGKMLAEMGIGLEDIGSLVFSELVQSPSLGKVTRDGFVDGAVDVDADSLQKLRSIVIQRRSQLSKDRALFKNVYNHTFTIALQGSQKALSSEMALEFWKLLFSSDGLEWRTASTNWLELWMEFQVEKWKKAVNKDLWRQTLTFAEETLKDETLGFWSEESSWPSVIDDFVGWVKAEKGVGAQPNGDAMEVE